MNKPLWLEVLCSKRYKQRQQEILREIAELHERRNPQWPRSKHTPTNSITRE